MDWLSAFSIVLMVLSIGEVECAVARKKIRIHIPQKVKHIHHHKKVYITKHMQQPTSFVPQYASSEQYAASYLNPDLATSVHPTIALLPLAEGRNSSPGSSPAPNIQPLYRARGHYGPPLDRPVERPATKSIISIKPASKKVRVIRISDKTKKMVLKKKPKRIIIDTTSPKEPKHNNNNNNNNNEDENKENGDYHDEFYSDTKPNQSTVKTVHKPKRVEKYVDKDGEHIHTYSEEHIHQVVYDDPKVSPDSNIPSTLLPLDMTLGQDPSMMPPLYPPLVPINMQNVAASHLPVNGFLDLPTLGTIGSLGTPAHMEYMHYNPLDVTHDHMVHEHGEFMHHIPDIKFSRPPKNSYRVPGVIKLNPEKKVPSYSGKWTDDDKEADAPYKNKWNSEGLDSHHKSKWNSHKESEKPYGHQWTSEKDLDRPYKSKWQADKDLELPYKNKWQSQPDLDLPYKNKWQSESSLDTPYKNKWQSQPDLELPYKNKWQGEKDFDLPYKSKWQGEKDFDLPYKSKWGSQDAKESDYSYSQVKWNTQDAKESEPHYSKIKWDSQDVKESEPHFTKIKWDAQETKGSDQDFAYYENFYPKPSANSHNKNIKINSNKPKAPRKRPIIENFKDESSIPSFEESYSEPKPVFKSKPKPKPVPSYNTGRPSHMKSLRQHHYHRVAENKPYSTMSTFYEKPKYEDKKPLASNKFKHYTTIYGSSKPSLSDYATYAAASTEYKHPNDPTIAWLKKQHNSKKAISTQNINFGGQEHKMTINHETSIASIGGESRLVDSDLLESSPKPIAITYSPIDYYNDMGVKALEQPEPSSNFRIIAPPMMEPVESQVSMVEVMPHEPMPTTESPTTTAHPKPANKKLKKKQQQLQSDSRKPKTRQEADKPVGKMERGKFKYGDRLNERYDYEYDDVIFI